MIFDNSLLVESFEFNKIPHWNCPYCSTGRLTPKSQFHEVETEESKRNRKVDDWDPTWINSQYWGLLDCNHCKNKIITAGVINVEEWYEYGDYGAHEVYYPKYFNPALNIISVKGLPPKLQQALTTCCNLFWFDKSAAANAIRSLVEIILSHYKIKLFPKTGKRIPLSLSKRLEDFRKIKPDETELLHAVKWLGHQGSHSTGSLTHEDLCTAYKLMNSVLEKLYSEEDKNLKKMATKINKSKGPPKKRRKKFIFSTKGVDTSETF